MKKLIASIVILFSLQAAALAAGTEDVLAHACGEWSWFAHVTQVPGASGNNPTIATPAEVAAPNEQTEIYALQNAPGQQWRGLTVLPGRAVALASRSSQLVVVMSNGLWTSIWSDGSATGQPLPAQGKIKAITDDGANLWAVGSVPGGIAAADRAIASEAAGTQPSTMPYFSDSHAQFEARTNGSIISNAPVASPRTVPSKMVVFREKNGRWTTVAELPADAVMTPDQEISITVIGGAPVVAFKTDASRIRTIEYAADHTWKDPAWITTVDAKPAMNFKLLGDGYKPLLWVTSGLAPGEIHPQRAGTKSAAMTLPWMGKDLLDGLPTATISGGYLCVFGPHNGKVMEQRYKLDGSPIETASEVTVLSDNGQSLLPKWIEIAFLTAMGFSAGAGVFRRLAEDPNAPAASPPVPAQLLPRLAAGLLDALPVIGAVVYLAIKTNSFNELGSEPGQISMLRIGVILGSAVLIYLLHTTIVEVLTGRSAGKWVFGLKVVTLEDTPPKKSQLLLRNLLRLIDPLLMIVVSPQGQRSGDTVAGTMVVPLEPLPIEDDEPLDLD